jgi:FkbM family methyltransferase
MIIVKKTLKKILKKCGFEIRRYEYSQEMMVRKYFHLINADLMIDVGANVGQSRDSMRRMGYKGRIVSFEPLSSAHQCLVERSKADKLWEIAPRMAIGDVAGECTLNISKNQFSSSILNILPHHLNTAPESVYVDSETAPCNTLDSVWGALIGNGPQSIFLKIDVQGYEDRVLRGVAENIGHVKGLQIELSVVSLYNKQILLHEMLRIIDELGFELFALLPGFSEKSSGRTLQFDGLFFRKDNRVYGL